MKLVDCTFKNKEKNKIQKHVWFGGSVSYEDCCFKIGFGTT